MAKPIFGVDFSGAKVCGKAIWITSAELDNDLQHVQIDSIQSAADKFEVRDREDVFEALQNWLRTEVASDAVVGIDFPFGLPRADHEETSWSEFLSAFATNFADTDISDFPGDFAHEARSRRETDYRYGGQSPTSPQVKYQVFHGLRDLLHPLVEDDYVRVAPMQEPAASIPTLIEVYPAATFGVEQLYRTGYKTTPDARNRREENATTLQERDSVTIDDNVVETAIESDDALDSLAEVIAVHRAFKDELARDGDHPEGYIYA